jgi:hypothetical protein
MINNKYSYKTSNRSVPPPIQTPVRRNIFFYSRKDKLCGLIMQLMEACNILQNFQLFCVDSYIEQKRVRELPEIIRKSKVPMLIVNDINIPLVGKNCLKWVNGIRMMQQKNMVETMNKRIVLKNMMMKGKNGPIAYVTNEMDGFSDGFAYTKSDHAQPHQYVSARLDNHNPIYTGPDQGKLSERDQKKKMADLKKIRENQEDEFSDKMIQEQAKILVQRETMEMNGRR